MFNADTASILVITSENAQNELRDWFSALQERQKELNGKWINGRVWRAELKRAEPPYGTLMCDGYYALVNALSEVMKLNGAERLGLALFAAVAVHVSVDKPGASFAAQLGQEIKGRVCISKLRFERLQ